jgi:Putative Zn-dependent protease, contains TPR repeats
MHPLRAAVLIFTLGVLMPVQALAATLLRDADIEYAMNRLAAPILQAAGLNPNRIRVLLIDDRTLNAFVADSDHIFIHSGLILKLERAAALQAVIAHEAAHIANGHLARRRANLRSARTAAGLGAILAAAAAAGGAGQPARGHCDRHPKLGPP